MNGYWRLKLIWLGPVLLFNYMHRVALYVPDRLKFSQLLYVLMFSNNMHSSILND